MTQLTIIYQTNTSTSHSASTSFCSPHFHLIQFGEPIEMIISHKKMRKEQTVTTAAAIFGLGFLLLMVLSTKTALAVNQTDLAAMQAALDEYLKENDVHYNPANVYGLGEEFSAGIMRSVRTKVSEV